MKLLAYLLFTALMLAPLGSQAQRRIEHYSRLLPVLPYIFFDTNSSTLSDRYVKYPHPARGAWFKEESIEYTQQVQQNYLNILGLRMTNNPATTISLRGEVSGENPQEKDTRLATDRALSVKHYLVHSWELDPARITIDSARYKQPSTPKHSDEFRRATISTKDWEIQKPIPVFKKDSRATAESFLLYDFKYASDDMGKLNKRIIREYIAPRIVEGSKVWIDAYIDQAEITDNRKRLMDSRENAVRDEIRKHTKVKNFTVASSEVTIQIDELVGNLAETNYICRRVEVIIERPLVPTE